MRKAVLIPKAKIKQDAGAILNIINICDRFHTMPKPGGLLDQDYLFVELLHNVLRWENERAELDAAKAKNSTPTR